MARVYVDNATDSTWDVYVDGERQGELAPHDIMPLDLRAGDRSIDVKQDQQVFDSVKADLSRQKSYIFNPGGMNTYCVLDARYIEEEAGEEGNSRTDRSISGEKWIDEQFDFDLLAELPASLLPGTPAARSKIYKEVSPSPTVEESFLILGRNRNAYDTLASGKALQRAFQSIGNARLDIETVEPVFRYLDGRPVAGMEMDAAKVLVGYMDEDYRPKLEQRIIDREAGRVKAGSESLSAHIALYMLAYGPDEMLDLFGKMAEAGRSVLVEQVFDVLAPAKPDVMRELRVRLAPLVVVSDDPDLRGRGLDLACDRAAVQDAEFVNAMDTALEGMTNEHVRVRIAGQWDNFLVDSLVGTRDQALQKRIAGMLDTDDANLQAKAAYLLVKSGRTDPVVAAFLGMTADRKQTLLKRIERGKHDMNDWTLICVGLRDADPSIRQAAFLAACDDYFVGLSELKAELDRAIQSERDAAAAELMTKALSSAKARQAATR